MSTQNNSPQSYLGGTWEQITDTFLLAAGTRKSAGDTGGSWCYSAAIGAVNTNNAQLGYAYRNPPVEVNTPNKYIVEGTNKGTSFSFTHYTVLCGEHGEVDETLPPYKAVYMWWRKA